MRTLLTESAERVMTLAATEARALNHSYVGTEHILLGLALEGSADAASTLARLGLNIDVVRTEIEKLIQHGPQTSLSDELPLTPRAEQAIQLAREEAACVSESQVGPEHLLIGLTREPDGVAAQVMKNLGLQLDRVRAEALRIRMFQFRIVERAVRPVRADIKHKRKMREELLAHLTAIYEEEFALTGDPFVAMEGAARRFGEPGKLSQELQGSVTAFARFGYVLESWFGWRAAESPVAMIVRTSALSFAMIVACMVPLLGGIILEGMDVKKQIALRVFGALAIITPTTQFGMGMCYCKMRDSLWGVFGSRRSRINAILWAALATLVATTEMIGVLVSLKGTFAGAGDVLSVSVLAGSGTAAACLLLARAFGFIEIRDAMWATLDLQGAA